MPLRLDGVKRALHAGILRQRLANDLFQREDLRRWRLVNRRRRIGLLGDVVTRRGFLCGRGQSQQTRQEKES